MPTKQFTLVHVVQWQRPLEVATLASALMCKIAPVHSSIERADAVAIARELLSGTGWAISSGELLAAAILAIEEMGGEVSTSRHTGTWDDKSQGA